MRQDGLQGAGMARKTFFLARLCRGEYPLGHTFWLWSCCGNVLLFLAADIVSRLLAGRVPADWICMVLGIVQFVFSMICLAGIWRSAGRSRGIWPILARSFVVCALAGALLFILM